MKNQVAQGLDSTVLPTYVSNFDELEGSQEASKTQSLFQNVFQKVLEASEASANIPERSRRKKKTNQVNLFKTRLFDLV